MLGTRRRACQLGFVNIDIVYCAAEFFFVYNHAERFKKMRNRFWACLLIFFSASAFAGPTSYEGGWMLSTDNQPEEIEWQLNYSFKSWLSAGVDYAYYQSTALQKTYVVSRANWLLKRWNELESQGNIYLYGGAGMLDASSTQSVAWLSGLELDWDSRNYYAAFRAQIFDAKDAKSDGMIQARVGIAPYLTKFENLHSWVIVQAQYFPNATTGKLRLTPLMRFYVSNVLWEMGVSTQGEWLFNTMVHF
jgi:hypothetical protein